MQTILCLGNALNQGTARGESNLRNMVLSIPLDINILILDLQFSSRLRLSPWDQPSEITTMLKYSSLFCFDSRGALISEMNQNQ